MKLLLHHAVLSLMLCTASIEFVCAAEDHQKTRQQPHASRIVNRVAATVNGRPITASEVRARLGPYIRELMMLYPQQGSRFNAELVKAKKEVLKELIERELVLSEFETKGYQMPESAIEEELNRRILAQFNGDRSILLDNLRKSGMTYSEFRESVRKEVTVAAMRSSRYDRGIPPTPDEIRAEYEATKADYRDISKDTIRYDKIFIPSVLSEDPNVTPEELLALSLEVKEKIEKGEVSFAEAARQYSHDMYAEDGGKWPSLKREDLAVEFGNIVFSLPLGQVSGPLRDPSGFTIVRVNSKTLAPAPPLSRKEVKEQVDDAVRRKQSEERYRQWIGRLFDKAIIRTFI